VNLELVQVLLQVTMLDFEMVTGSDLLVLEAAQLVSHIFGQLLLSQLESFDFALETTRDVLTQLVHTPVNGTLEVKQVEFHVSHLGVHLPIEALAFLWWTSD